MKINKKTAKYAIKVVGIIGIFSVGLLIGLYIFSGSQSNNNSGNDSDPISDDDLLFRKPPLSSSFLDDEGGITMYFNAGETLDLSVAEAEFKTIEEQTTDYIIGSLGLPDLPETEDVHCLVHKDGWIVCFYLKQEPTSKIVDWNYYTGGTLTKTKLYEGLEIIANAYPTVLISNAQYYHYHYQNANKLMIIIEDGDDTFNLFLPNEFIFYEKSYYFETYYGDSIGGSHIDVFSGQLTQGVTHTITMEYVGNGWAGLYVDGTLVKSVGSTNYYRVAITLVYDHP